MKGLLLSIFSLAITFGFSQTPNNCNEYTSTGTTSSPYGAGTNAACNALVPGVVTGTGAWTGSGCAGFITSTVTGPPVSCLTISYAYVNTDDFGIITTNTGGTLTITGVNVGVVGTTVGPYQCAQTFPYGNVSITVCSTVPFTSVTLTNSGCTSGWVVNCVQQTNPCDASWTLPTPCSTDPPLSLDALITGDTGGTWSGTGVTGSNFDPAAGSQTVTYTAPGGCTSAQLITVSPTADATWTLPTGLCSNGASIDLNTFVTGTAGGTWSGTGVTGNMFNPSSGSQNVTYTVGTAPCDATSMQMINVTPALDPTWASPGIICEAAGSINLDILVSGDPGGTWSGTGVTGNTFNPAGLSGPISVTYTIGTAPCIGTDQQNITVNPDADPTWLAPTTLCDDSPLFDLTSVLSGTAGGTWSGTGVTGNMFDPAAGSQTVTYTVGTAPCVETLALMINVGVAPNPAWTTLTMCAGDAPMNLNNQITGSIGGTWTGTGVSGFVFDPFFGTQTVTYTVTNGSCTALSAQAITVVDPTLTVTGTNVTCFGLTDGSTGVTVAGGSGTYTYNWNTNPSQNTANATNIGAGTYSVTVTDGSCVVTDSITIIEPAEITATMSAVNGCNPDLGMATINATGGVGGFTYVWNNSPLTTANASGLDSNMHTVIVTDANGCTYTDSILVQLFPAPIVVTLLDTTIIYGDCIDLSATGANSYTWTPDADLSCGNCATPNTCPTSLSIYCVEGTDVNGCKSSDCVTIDVEIICGDVFVPSAFSPNDDGENDNLCVYSDCMKSMTFSIYNRWGEKVYETNSMNICWDGTWKGKVLNSAVFVYTLDGYLINGELVEQKGNISLIR